MQQCQELSSGHSYCQALPATLLWTMVTARALELFACLTASSFNQLLIIFAVVEHAVLSLIAVSVGGWGVLVTLDVAMVAQLT